MQLLRGQPFEPPECRGYSGPKTIMKFNEMLKLQG